MCGKKVQFSAQAPLLQGYGGSGATCHVRHATLVGMSTCVADNDTLNTGHRKKIEDAKMQILVIGLKL